MRRNMATVDINELIDYCSRNMFSGYLDLSEAFYILKAKNTHKVYGYKKFNDFLENKMQVLSKRVMPAIRAYQLLIVEMMLNYDDILSLSDDKMILIYESLRKIKNPLMEYGHTLISLAKKNDLSEFKEEVKELLDKWIIIDAQKEEEKLFIEQQIDRLSNEYNIPKKDIKLFYAFVSATMNDKNITDGIKALKEYKQKQCLRKEEI